MLHYFSKCGDLNEMETLLKRGVNVDEIDIYTGEASLHAAVEESHYEAVKLLIKYNAKINIVDKDGNTPLHYAAENGDLSIVEYLLQCKANINAKNKYGISALHLAVKEEEYDIIEHLVKNMANINIVDNENESILHWANKFCSLDGVKYIIELGVNKSIKNIHGKTAFDMTVDKDYKRILLYYGTNWTPDNHDKKSSSLEKEQILTLMMIRNQADHCLSSLPREIMFEIFSLFVF